MAQAAWRLAPEVGEALPPRARAWYDNWRAVCELTGDEARSVYCIKGGGAAKL
jgi:hypothetical protein